MTTDQLIAKQQLELEDYKEKSADIEKKLNDLMLRFIAVGAPLNDNVLQFNREQIMWLQGIYTLLEQI